MAVQDRLEKVFALSYLLKDIGVGETVHVKCKFIFSFIFRFLIFGLHPHRNWNRKVELPKLSISQFTQLTFAATATV